MTLLTLIFCNVPLLLCACVCTGLHGSFYGESIGPWVVFGGGDGTFLFLFTKFHEISSYKLPPTFREILFFAWESYRFSKRRLPAGWAPCSFTSPFAVFDHFWYSRNLRVSAEAPRKSLPRSRLSYLPTCALPITIACRGDSATSSRILLAIIQVKVTCFANNRAIKRRRRYRVTCCTLNTVGTVLTSAFVFFVNLLKRSLRQERLIVCLSTVGIC